jgi:hypothetical protein
MNQQATGSPDSVVASVISTVALNGSKPIVSASAKLLFEGAAANAGLTPLNASTNTVTMVMVWLRNFVLNIFAPHFLLW